MPWLSWHDLRRTFATLADQEKISIGERKTLMGHGRAEMTLPYTQVPTQQACEVLEALSDKIITAAALGPAPQNVVEISRRRRASKCPFRPDSVHKPHACL